VLARGDRRLGQVLLALRGRSLRAWQRAMQACDLRPEDYVRARGAEEALPWSFVRTGVSTRYLARERERAARGAPTAPCPPSGCTQCGVCDESVG
ncbi:MAG: B12-binding domain-containing radical SAM protein, partial [Anaerolineae bacterium]|nr:B12-binding domain-containing radical SAM protein [Anaerolineae bacterium]